MNMQHSIIMFNIKIDYASMQYIKRIGRSLVAIETA